MLIVLFSLLATLSLAEGDPQAEVLFQDRWYASKNEQGQIDLLVDSPEEIAGLQFTLEYNSNQILLGKPELTPNNQHFFLQSAGDSNSLKVVAFSMEGKELDLSGPVLTIPLSVAGGYQGTAELMVKDFVASSPKGTRISLRVSGGKIYIVPSLPKRFRLSSNFPNPFNAETEIQFDLPEDAMVTLAIYNVLGQKIRDLKGGVLPAGFYSIIWDGKENSGLPAPSGAYVCSLKVGANHHTMKMVLLR